MSTASTRDHTWTDLIGPARGFLERPDFESLERDYKLLVAASIEPVIEAIQQGTEIYEPLKACLRHKANNLLPWRLVDDALKWGQAEPEDATAALAAVFDAERAPLVALKDFLDLLPKEVISGLGTRLALASFFLMGRDPENYPIYRKQVTRKVRKLARWESEATNEVDEYRETLEMFSSFQQAANKAGVRVESALHAQGVLYAIAKWEPGDDWAPQLRASVQRLRQDRGLSDGTPSLKKALADYNQADAEGKLRSAFEQRDLFVSRFPAEVWDDLPAERYVLGLDDSEDGVSHTLEYVTPECGSIAGGSASKHLLYFSRQRNSFKFEPKYENHEQAWTAIRAGVKELVGHGAAGEFSEIDQIDSLWAGPAVRTKLAWLYFPDQLLPIYAESHLDFWLSIFRVESNAEGRVSKNRVLLEALESMEEFEGWQPLEIMHFLYSWTEPNPGHSIVKIAPGREAYLWEDCVRHGYIRLGFDETDDLSLFDTDDELQSHYESVYPDSNKSTTTSTLRALKQFRGLKEGDIVVANHGTKKVLGIGTVTGAYRFDTEQTEYRHVVEVDWFDTKERAVDFGAAWMSTLVSIKSDDYHKILGSNGEKQPDPSAIPLPVIPSMHRETEMLLERSGQVIFYGPPGTGKTYAARRHAAWLLQGGSKVPEAARAFGEAAELTQMESSFLQMQQTDERPSWVIVANPKYWSFDELFEKGQEQWDFGRLKRNYELVAPGDEVFGYEATPIKKVVATGRVTRALYTNEAGNQNVDIEPVVRPVNQVSYETLTADRILSNSEPVAHRMQGTLFKLDPAEAEQLRRLAGISTETTQVETGVAQLTRVTFHPTYSYEDFIEGYKPTESGAGGLELEMRAGVFKRVCRAAAADPDRPYVLVIDEINRGNVPKIFGELITLIEKDKRGMALTLPQSRESFHVPDNVHIIATMNTADRSIHILDTALRRRFAFVELLPDPEVLNESVGPLPLDGFLAELNTRIRNLVGREKQIGHAVLMRGGQPITAPKEFALTFKYELLPLLQEYTYGNYADLAELLGGEVVDEENQITRTAVLDDPERLIDALATHLEIV